MSNTRKGDIIPDNIRRKAIGLSVKKICPVTRKLSLVK